jgi:prephenate dehydrogenase
MQGAAQAPKGPLVKLLEGFHSPCTACIRLVEWRDRKSIVTLLTRTTNHF